MSAANATDPMPEVRHSLRPFRNRAQQIFVGQAVLWLSAAFLLVVLLLLWFDTVIALPAAFRWGVTRPGLIMLAAAALVFIIWRLSRFSAEGLAREIDSKHATGGQILSGLQLESYPVQPTGELSQSFAKIAVDRTRQAVEKISPTSVFKLDELKHGAWCLGISAIVVAGIFGLAPAASKHQLNRFLFPNSDIPPFTGVIIELELEKTSLLYGDDALVAATVSRGTLRSGANERMTLVAITADGRESLLPMLSQSDGRWQALLTRVTEPITVYARSGDSQSRKVSIDVVMTPQVLPPQVTITPPTYTRQGIYQGPIPETGLRGLAGTKVEFNVNSNRPLAAGIIQLHLQDNVVEEVSLTPVLNPSTQMNAVAGEFTLTSSGQFELTVMDEDGIESKDPITGRIDILADQRPVVRIVRPRPMSLATPDVQLPVEVIAEDDFGVSSLTLFRSLNGSPATPVAAQLSNSPHETAQWMLPLPAYKLQPGDEIQLFARAEDNDPDGPKGAESPITVIKIISVSDFQEMMVQQQGAQALEAKYQQARRHFEQVAEALRELQEAQEELAANPDSNAAQEKLAEKLAAAEEAAKTAAEAIEELSKQALPIDIDQELAKKLAEMAKQAAAMQEQLAAMQSTEDQPQAPLSEEQKQQLQEMLDKAQENQKRLTEEAIEPLKNLEKMMPLMMAEQRFAQIAQQQRDLAERLKSLQSLETVDEQTQRRIAELEAEQEQLRQNLSQLLDEIETRANELGDDPELNKIKTEAINFAQAVRDSQAQAEMAASQQEMLKENFADSQQAAERAAEILESFLSQCQGMGESASQNCERGFRPSKCNMGNSLQQMMAMMGMKPGSSGTRPGGKPGMGTGFGAGGGYAQRTPGPQNMGLYGSIPMSQNQPRSGRGDQSTPGIISTNSNANQTDAAANANSLQENRATGQAAQNVPAQYRSQVAEYYRNLTEALGDIDQ